MRPFRTPFSDFQIRHKAALTTVGMCALHPRHLFIQVGTFRLSFAEKDLERECDCFLELVH